MDTNEFNYSIEYYINNDNLINESENDNLKMFPNNVYFNFKVNDISQSSDETSAYYRLMKFFNVENDDQYYKDLNINPNSMRYLGGVIFDCNDEDTEYYIYFYKNGIKTTNQINTDSGYYRTLEILKITLYPYQTTNNFIFNQYSIVDYDIDISSTGGSIAYTLRNKSNSNIIKDVYDNAVNKINNVTVQINEDTTINNATIAFVSGSLTIDSDNIQTLEESVTATNPEIGFTNITAIIYNPGYSTNNKPEYIYSFVTDFEPIMNTPNSLTSTKNAIYVSNVNKITASSTSYLYTEEQINNNISMNVSLYNGINADGLNFQYDNNNIELYTNKINLNRDTLDNTFTIDNIDVTDFFDSNDGSSLNITLNNEIIDLIKSSNKLEIYNQNFVLIAPVEHKESVYINYKKSFGSNIDSQLQLTNSDLNITSPYDNDIKVIAKIYVTVTPTLDTTNNQEQQVPIYIEEINNDNLVINNTSFNYTGNYCKVNNDNKINSLSSVFNTKTNILNVKTLLLYKVIFGIDINNTISLYNIIQLTPSYQITTSSDNYGLQNETKTITFNYISYTPKSYDIDNCIVYSNSNNNTAFYGSINLTTYITDDNNYYVEKSISSTNVKIPLINKLNNTYNIQLNNKETYINKNDQTNLYNINYILNDKVAKLTIPESITTPSFNIFSTTETDYNFNINNSNININLNNMIAQEGTTEQQTNITADITNTQEYNCSGLKFKDMVINANDNKLYDIMENNQTFSLNGASILWNTNEQDTPAPTYSDYPDDETSITEPIEISNVLGKLAFPINTTYIDKEDNDKEYNIEINEDDIDSVGYKEVSTTITSTSTDISYEINNINIPLGNHNLYINGSDYNVIIGDPEITTEQDGDAQTTIYKYTFNITGNLSITKTITKTNIKYTKTKYYLHWSSTIETGQSPTTTTKEISGNYETEEFETQQQSSQEEPVETIYKYTLSNSGDKINSLIFTLSSDLQNINTGLQTQSTNNYITVNEQQLDLGVNVVSEKNNMTDLSNCSFNVGSTKITNSSDNKQIKTKNSTGSTLTIDNIIGVEDNIWTDSNHESINDNITGKIIITGSNIKFGTIADENMTIKVMIDSIVKNENNIIVNTNDRPEIIEQEQKSPINYNWYFRLSRLVDDNIANKEVPIHWEYFINFDQTPFGYNNLKFDFQDPSTIYNNKCIIENFEIDNIVYVNNNDQTNRYKLSANENGVITITNIDQNLQISPVFKLTNGKAIYANSSPTRNISISANIENTAFSLSGLSDRYIDTGYTNSTYQSLLLYNSENMDINDYMIVSNNNKFTVIYSKNIADKILVNNLKIISNYDEETNIIEYNDEIIPVRINTELYSNLNSPNKNINQSTLYNTEITKPCINIINNEITAATDTKLYTKEINNNFYYNSFNCIRSSIMDYILIPSYTITINTDSIFSINNQFNAIVKGNKYIVYVYINQTVLSNLTNSDVNMDALIFKNYDYLNGNRINFYNQMKLKVCYTYSNKLDDLLNNTANYNNVVFNVLVEDGDYKTNENQYIIKVNKNITLTDSGVTIYITTDKFQYPFLSTLSMIKYSYLE